MRSEITLLSWSLVSVVLIVSLYVRYRRREFLKFRLPTFVLYLYMKALLFY